MEGGSGWQELLLARAPQNLLSKSSPANLLSIRRIHFFISLMNKEKEFGLSPLPWDTLLPRTASPTDAQTVGGFPL